MVLYTPNSSETGVLIPVDMTSLKESSDAIQHYLRKLEDSTMQDSDNDSDNNEFAGHKKATRHMQREIAKQPGVMSFADKYRLGLVGPHGHKTKAERNVGLSDPVHVESEGSNSGSEPSVENNKTDASSACTSDSEFLDFQHSDLRDIDETFSLESSKEQVWDLLEQLHAGECVHISQQISEWFAAAVDASKSFESDLNAKEQECLELEGEHDQAHRELRVQIETRDAQAISCMRRFYSKVQVLRPPDKRKDKLAGGAALSAAAAHDAAAAAVQALSPRTVGGRNRRGSAHVSFGRREVDEADEEESPPDVHGEGLANKTARAPGPRTAPRPAPVSSSAAIATELLDVIAAQQDEIANLRARSEINSKSSGSLKGALDWVRERKKQSAQGGSEFSKIFSQAEGVHLGQRMAVSMNDACVEVIEDAKTALKVNAMKELLAAKEGRDILRRTHANAKGGAEDMLSHLLDQHTQLSVDRVEMEQLQNRAMQLNDDLSSVGHPRDRENALQQEIGARQSSHQLEARRTSLAGAAMAPRVGGKVPGSADDSLAKPGGQSSDSTTAGSGARSRERAGSAYRNDIEAARVAGDDSVAATLAEVSKPAVATAVAAFTDAGSGSTTGSRAWTDGSAGAVDEEVSGVASSRSQQSSNWFKARSGLAMGQPPHLQEEVQIESAKDETKQFQTAFIAVQGELKQLDVLKRKLMDAVHAAGDRMVDEIEDARAKKERGTVDFSTGPDAEDDASCSAIQSAAKDIREHLEVLRARQDFLQKEEASLGGRLKAARQAVKDGERAKQSKTREAARKGDLSSFAEPSLADEDSASNGKRASRKSIAASLRADGGDRESIPDSESIVKLREQRIASAQAVETLQIQEDELNTRLADLRQQYADRHTRGRKAKTEDSCLGVTVEAEEETEVEERKEKEREADQESMQSEDEQGKKGRDEEEVGVAEESRQDIREIGGRHEDVSKPLLHNERGSESAGGPDVSLGEKSITSAPSMQIEISTLGESNVGVEVFSSGLPSHLGLTAPLDPLPSYALPMLSSSGLPSCPSGWDESAGAPCASPSPVPPWDISLLDNSCASQGESQRPSPEGSTEKRLSFGIVGSHRSSQVSADDVSGRASAVSHGSGGSAMNFQTVRTVVVDKREEQITELLFYQAEHQRLKIQISDIEDRIRVAKLRGQTDTKASSEPLVEITSVPKAIPSENRQMRRQVAVRQRELNELRKLWWKERERHKNTSQSEGPDRVQLEQAIKLLIREQVVNPKRFQHLVLPDLNVVVGEAARTDAAAVIQRPSAGSFDTAASVLNRSLEPADRSHPRAPARRQSSTVRLADPGAERGRRHSQLASSLRAAQKQCSGFLGGPPAVGHAGPLISSTPVLAHSDMPSAVVRRVLVTGSPEDGAHEERPADTFEKVLRATGLRHLRGASAEVTTAEDQSSPTPERE